MKTTLLISPLLFTASAQAHQSASSGIAHALEHGLLYGLLAMMAYLGVRALNKGRGTPVKIEKSQK
ncbi:MAG: hypothetical protein ACPG4N_09275 [Gammaproteobacteria bacterium]